MDRIIEKNIVQEVKDSFLEYSMSVIVSRAIPDLRDGLKPVHRRILYSMYESGYTSDKAHRKSARIVGDVMGKYHPHGDSSIYDAMVRMAQPFSFRHMLVDGHGNFGNLDGDGAAAMRYTEARLSKLSLEMVRDINKDTVNFKQNFDETEEEPEVLPSRFPNILVNGSMGIAVGMATNIPPHNLGEVIDGCVAYIDIKGPDFPTGGIILGNSGIRKAYDTGKGTITIRGKIEMEEKNGKNKIIVTELPYQVNKKEFQERIGQLVREKVIDGISDLHEESNLENPVRVVIYLKKDANPNVVLNNLYKHTQLQVTYGINLLMIDQQTPKVFSLKEVISKYIDYQKEIIIRRTKFDLNKAEARVHILEGLKIALDNIDEIIKLIKESKGDEEAQTKLIERFGLTEIQAKAILEMKLRRLTGLERDKIEQELKELLEKIEYYKQILGSEQKVLEIIKEELIEIKNKYSDDRRTNIDMTAIDYIEDESLIPVEDIVVTLTQKGYIKRMNSDNYKSQNRGGVGIKGMATNEEDFVSSLISLTTHDYVLFFTNKGKVYRIKGYEIPLFSRQSKGLPIINLLPLEKEEVVTTMLKIDREENSKYIVFCTQNGLVKRTNIKEFNSIRKNGKIAITLKDDDELIAARKTDETKEVLIASTNGRMIRFNEEEIRIMGRTASGVKGITVGDGKCVGCEIADEGQQILVVTEKGYGKRTNIDEYRMTHRGSKGVKALNITDKNGNIVSFKVVEGNEDLVIVTDNGIIIRLPLEQVSTTGRVAQGVKLINLKENQKVSTVTLMEKESEHNSIEEETKNEN